MAGCAVSKRQIGLYLDPCFAISLLQLIPSSSGVSHAGLSKPSWSWSHLVAANRLSTREQSANSWQRHLLCFPKAWQIFREQRSCVYRYAPLGRQTRKPENDSLLRGHYRL